jgi:choline-sulfatase
MPGDVVTQTQPANLIIFVSDNHNSTVLGCAGHPAVDTPTLDRLAATGARFDNAYCASPICAPARAALATGRFPHQTGHWDNCLVFDGSTDSWMHRLRAAGHCVTSVGKLHFRRSGPHNGFSEELLPLHIINGVGALTGLLRASDRPPSLAGQWEFYAEQSGPGTSDYQDYDRDITQAAITWLRDSARSAGADAPWVLLVSYPSVHPPFSVPERLWQRYVDRPMPLPAAFAPGQRCEHPAFQHLRQVWGWQDMTDEDMLRRVAAGYCALTTHLDEQIGAVLDVAAEEGLLDSTRVLYTSDHGESLGHQGLFGKAHLLDSAAKVPLLMAGPGVPRGQVIHEPVSAVDLFPTILEAAGCDLQAADADLPGQSLWPAIAGEGHAAAPIFAEFHGNGTKAGTYMLRLGNHKLIRHAGGMPSQLFDLQADPHECHDLAAEAAHRDQLKALENQLAERLDIDAVDARAKADQRAYAETHGGFDAIRRQGNFAYTPPPGSKAVYQTR